MIACIKFFEHLFNSWNSSIFVDAFLGNLIAKFLNIKRVNELLFDKITDVLDGLGQIIKEVFKLAGICVRAVLLTIFEERAQMEEKPFLQLNTKQKLLEQPEILFANFLC